MPSPIYDSSIFKEFFEENDPELLVWVDNVMAKLQAKGILANYIIKDTDESDSDFNDLYYPIVKFFGYLVRLTREFDDFKTSSKLSNTYLLNKGHYTCGDETLDQLLFLITNLLRRRAKRGSINTIQPATNPDNADGEILSLLCWDELTFFKLGVARPERNSWNVNNSSPLHRGCTGRYDLNIGYEYTEDVKDLNLYPIQNPAFVKLTEYRYKNCIEIEDTPFAQEAGIGLTDFDKRIIINPNYNYEITFFVSQDATHENLTFGVKCFDFTNTAINLKSVVDNSNRNFFFQTRRLNKAGTFYFVRGIIFNKDQNLMTAQDAKLNIGFGQNLKFSEDAVSIIPYIVMDNNLINDSEFDGDYFDSESIDYFESDDSDSVSADSDYYDGSGSIYLWNIKVTPCSTDYERCYLNNKNFIDAIVNNKNGEYNVPQIKDILRKYFIPYNTAFNLVNLPRSVEQIENLSYLKLETDEYILLENGSKILLENQN